jgi:hypothetical protein
MDQILLCVFLILRDIGSSILASIDFYLNLHFYLSSEFSNTQYVDKCQTLIVPYLK